MVAQARGLEGGYTSASPALNAAVVTPSDTTDLPNPAIRLWVGGAGNVTLDTVGGSTSVLFAALPAGTLLSVQVKRVRATGTSATNIVALY
jgi:hypothetical protein